MAMTEQQIQAKIDALTAKKKEIQKKERAKKKKALAKEKEAEAKKVAHTNAIIADLARMWHGCESDEALIHNFAKSIVSKYPEKKEIVEAMLK